MEDKNGVGYTDGSTADNIVFSSKTTEMMRFEPDGKIYVRGELVENNKQVFEEFKRWLSMCSRGAVGKVCPKCGTPVVTG